MPDEISSEDQLAYEYEDPYDAGAMGDEKSKKDGISRLMEFMGMNNIAEEVDADKLKRIGMDVIDQMEEDYDSCSNWRDTHEDAMKLAKQVREEKTWPWTGAASIKYPLIGQAAMNFNARAYPEIVQGDRVAKARVIGDDQDQAKQDRSDRISEHMSYQLLEEIPNWDSDTDKLTMILPIVGTMFREVTWDEIELVPEINLLMPDELIVNYHAKSLKLEHCRRISKKVTLFKNDIKERERAGLWIEVDYKENMSDGNDSAEPIEKDEQEFVQQIRYIDLDDDGYEEPYIVTVHEASKRVVRIIANYDERTVKFNPETGEITKIKPYRIYTDYHFIPSFDGSFFSTGFGSYLYAINQTIDTLLNQLVDAGTLSNLQSGFISKGARIRGGSKPMQPGEWRPAEAKGMDLKNAIVPLPAKEPSATLV